MKQILYLLLAITPHLLHAQDNRCEYERNEIDEFEKIRVVITKEESVRYGFGYPLVRLSLKRVGDEYGVIMNLSHNSAVCLGPDSELLFLKENDEVVRMTHDQSGVKCTEYQRVSGITVYSNKFIFQTSETDLISLESGKIKKVRISTPGSIIEIDLTKKNMSKDSGTNYFSKNVKCVIGAF